MQKRVKFLAICLVIAGLGLVFLSQSGTQADVQGQYQSTVTLAVTYLVAGICLVTTGVVTLVVAFSKK